MEEKKPGQDLLMLMPTGEKIPFGKIDDHVSQFPEFEPGGWVGPAAGRPPQYKFSGECVIKMKEEQRLQLSKLCKPILSPDIAKKLADQVLASMTPLAEEFKLQKFEFKVPSVPKHFPKRLCRGHKLPRKLKKACTHIQIEIKTKTPERPTPDLFFRSFTVVYFRTKDGYPFTKWIHKAIGKAQHEMKVSSRSIMQDMAKYANAICLNKMIEEMKGKRL